MPQLKAASGAAGPTPREGRQDARELCGVLAQYVRRGSVSAEEKREAVERAVAERYLARR
jgi:hypothetical protein